MRLLLTRVLFCRLENEPLPAPPSYSATMIITVPNDVVGRVIGRAGETSKT